MSEQEIDSQLKELLDLLRPVPRRSTDSIQQSRSRFYAELDTFFPVGMSQSVPVQVSTSVAPVREPPVRNVPAPRPRRMVAQPKPWFYRPVFAYIAVALMIVLAMFSGSFITVLAAGSALPGDALYAVKLNAEDARAYLTTDPARKAELYLEFAQNRLGEMNTLAALGQYDRLAPLAAQFNQEVFLAVNMARRLSDRDPGRALQLENQAMRSLALLKVTIGAVVSNAPTTVQPALQAAFEDALEVTPTVENPNANSNGNGGGLGNGNGNGNPAPPNNNSSANANSNSNGAPGLSNNNGQGNDNSNANPNADPNNNNGQGQNNNGQDKNNNGQDKNNNGQDKNNNGQDKNNNGQDKNNNGQDR